MGAMSTSRELHKQSKLSFLQEVWIQIINTVSNFVSIRSITEDPHKIK